jgi:hypothetical protein
MLDFQRNFAVSDHWIYSSAGYKMSFLTLDRFLEHFPDMSMSKDEFARRFTVMYATPQSLHDIFELTPVRKGKTEKILIKNPETDKRYQNRLRVIDYFYEIIITNRHRYLSYFYQAYFEFKDPRTLDWSDKHDILSYPDTFAPHPVISLQKNDASRRMIRSLFYLELLHETKVTNTVKSHVSFWESLTNMYNLLQLEDRFFAPSSIDLFLKEKGTEKERKPGAVGINYNNLFYLFQAYQPKASIFNPYSICWIMRNLVQGKKIFTPVLSWCSYISAFMHSEYQEYLGVDVMPTVCKKALSLAEYYQGFGDQFKKKSVDIICSPSEVLITNKSFMDKYTGYFDTVLLCPPYFDMEIYSEGDQSVKSYPTYEEWLDKYWRPTVHLCFQLLCPGGKFALIANDYNTLTGEVRMITEDFDRIVKERFKTEAISMYYLQNRTSPLRVNAKDRTERLFLYQKSP